MNIKRARSQLLLLVLASTLAVVAEAQDRHPGKDGKFWVELAAYYPSQNIRVSVDSEVLGENLPIHFEKDFDLSEKKALPMVEIGFRFGKKWSLALQYLETERSRRQNPNSEN